MVIDKPKKSAILRLMIVERNESKGFSGSYFDWEIARNNARDQLINAREAADEEKQASGVSHQGMEFKQPAAMVQGSQLQANESSPAVPPISQQEKPLARQAVQTSPSRPRAASQPEAMRVPATA